MPIPILIDDHRLCIDHGRYILGFMKMIRLLPEGISPVSVLPLVCSNGQQKNTHHKWESIPSCLLSRRVCLLAFEASGIEPVPLAFKASATSTAPVVLHYASEGSQM